MEWYIILGGCWFAIWFISHIADEIKKSAVRPLLERQVVQNTSVDESVVHFVVSLTNVGAGTALFINGPNISAPPSDDDDEETFDDYPTCTVDHVKAQFEKRFPDVHVIMDVKPYLLVGQTWTIHFTVPIEAQAAFTDVLTKTGFYLEYTDIMGTDYTHRSFITIGRLNKI